MFVICIVISQISPAMILTASLTHHLNPFLMSMFTPFLVYNVSFRFNIVFHLYMKLWRSLYRLWSCDIHCWPLLLVEIFGVQKLKETCKSFLFSKTIFSQFLYFWSGNDFKHGWGINRENGKGSFYRPRRYHITHHQTHQWIHWWGVGCVSGIFPPSPCVFCPFRLPYPHGTLVHFWTL